MRSLSVFILTTLLLLTSVPALQISPEYDTNVIVKNVQSEISLNLNITNATPGTYNLYTLADIDIKPSDTFQITTNPQELEFTISPKESLDLEGNYAFTYILNHRGYNKTEQRMLLKILNLEEVIEISSDPVQQNSEEISIIIQNKEEIHLKNLTAKFSSILFQTEEITFDLEPKESLKTKAGVYIIKSVFQTATEEKEIEGNLYLGEKKGITTTEDNSGILTQRKTITKVNAGNVVESIQIQIDKNIVSRLFTTFNIEPTLIQRDGLIIQYTWFKERLQPTGAYTIKSKTNYLLPLLILILATLAFAGFKRFSETKLEIRKSVTPVKTKNGEFALRVRLALKAKKDIENVSLTDKVPAIVKIYKKFGNVQPDKIDPKSRRIHWHIGDLEAGEERLFNYIIYSKVGVVGKFSLPRALAIFEKDSQIHEIDSNNVFFMNEQTNK